MARVLVVYNSMTGNTEAAAQAVAKGAEEAGAKVVLKTARRATVADLVDCGGVALGSYDAFSYMGGDLKDFFDRVFYPTQGKVADKPYVAFVTHGGGGAAIKSIEALAGTLKLKKAAPSVSVKGRPDEKAGAELMALGAKLAQAAGK
jgi:flavorubredoxin